MSLPRYSIRNQLLVLGVVATGSIWVGALLQYGQLRRQEAYLREVRAELAASRLYFRVVQHAARERGLTNGWLLKTETESGADTAGRAPAAPPGASLPAPLVRERAALDAALAALARDTQGPAGAEVQRQRADIEYYRTLVNNHAVVPAVAFAGYSRLIAALQATAARQLAEGMRSVGLPYEHLNHINQAVEELAQLRGLVFGVLSRHRLDDGPRLDITRQMTLYREYMRLYQQTKPVGVLVLETHGFEPARIERVLGLVQGLLTAPALPAVDWWPLATAAVDELQGLAEREAVQLSGLADARIASLERQLLTTVVALVLLGLVTLGLVLVTVGRVVRGLGAVLRGLDSVAERGNFGTRLDVGRADEFGTIGVGVNKLIALASQTVDQHERTSRQDGLTQVLNRRGLDAELQARAQRQHAPAALSLLLLDVDHFKRVNDDFGHPEGDRVLVAVARLIQQTVRPGDAIGRYGGEEFLVLLGGCARADAARLAEALRRAVAQHDFALPRAVTVSVGVAERRPDESTASLIARADRALYKAKAEGRNMVVSEP